MLEDCQASQTTEKEDNVYVPEMYAFFFFFKNEKVVTQKKSGERNRIILQEYGNGVNPSCSYASQ